LGSASIQPEKNVKRCLDAIDYALCDMSSALPIQEAVASQETTTTTEVASAHPFNDAFYLNQTFDMTNEAGTRAYLVTVTFDEWLDRADNAFIEIYCDEVLRYSVYAISSGC
jgi:hypothetical protein